MFRRQQRSDDGSQSVPERAGYTKYYEHDGQLRAYANRSMFLAGLFGVIALGSLGFAIYVRLQPATVIRVSADGEATVVGGRPAGSAPASLAAAAAAKTFSILWLPRRPMSLRSRRTVSVPSHRKTISSPRR